MQSTSKQPTKGRRSKLAQENEISAQDEADIKDAWGMFAVHDIEGFEEEGEGVIRTEDVRRAMKYVHCYPNIVHLSHNGRCCWVPLMLSVTKEPRAYRLETHKNYPTSSRPLTQNQSAM